VHTLWQALIEVVERSCPHRMARAHELLVASRLAVIMQKWAPRPIKTRPFLHDHERERGAVAAADMTARRARHDMTERSDTADMIEPKLTNEPIENADANDPMQPIDSIEPTEPMDRIDPREPMLRIEPSDLIDNNDRCGIHPSWRGGTAGR
jgi:hypothetical protein